MFNNWTFLYIWTRFTFCLENQKANDMKQNTYVCINLVGGFNPFENISQIGSFPQEAMNIKNIWNHHLEIYY